MPSGFFLNKTLPFTNSRWQQVNRKCFGLRVARATPRRLVSMNRCEIRGFLLGMISASDEINRMF
jgi:hypothetical protein